MKRFYCTAAIVSLFLSCIAQPLSKNDYNRAVSYLWSNLNNQYIYNANIIPIWFGDNSGFAFVAYQNDKKIFNKLSWADTKNQPLFDHQRLAQILSELTSTEVDSQNLGLTNLRIPRPNTMFFTFGNDDYKLSLDDYTIEKQIRSLRNSLESTSPDQKWTAYVQDYNLFLRSNETNESKQLSTNGKKFYEFGSNYGWSDIIEGENGDRPSRVSIRWSPDSKWIQSYITDLRNAEKMYLLDWSIDTLYKPKLLSYYRASPGDTNIVRMIPIFYNVYSGEEIVKDELRSTHTNPISYRWSKQSDIVYQENTFRGYQKIHLHRLDLQSKSEELLYEEISNTNIDNYQSRIYEEIGIALIISERDGWKQIYQLNLMDKSLS
ncbi:MAG TPA: DPP IV N-terminal domain-containing protein, partial [Saprospiraceae bacterium]|nr:DPP IV N-terminal domain-containing protein [Saprospiraceae bacterium]